MRSLALDAQAVLGHELSRLDLAWESFVLNRHRDPEVRPVILHSWERCLDNSIDAFKNKPPRSISQGEARDRRENDPLFRELNLVLSSLTESAFESEHMLVCCDGRGTILQIEGDPALQKRAEAMNFVVGSAWGEEKAGTNAIGTAITTGRSVRVLGPEHYCHNVHPWTCSASPIRDPATKVVLGVIDLTGPREVFHPHTLAVVLTATNLIEERLRSKFEIERFRLLERYFAVTAQAPTVPVAVLDRGLRVVKASPAFYDGGWIDREDHLIGCPLNELALPEELTWEAEGRDGRWDFVLRSCGKDGRPIGVIVQMVRGAKAPQQNLRPADPRFHDTDFQGQRGRALHSFATLVGESPSFKAALSVAQSAGNHLPVIIGGETGTGKELIAQAIHTGSIRKRGPFIPVNCAAIPKELASSELFGFEGGTFTGAARDGRTGKFEQANGGTIFLDEIGDMQLELQGLLLRVLEEGEVVHLGGRKAIAVDVRVIAATNQDLAAAVERGAFRRDLYYRLNVISIHMPALRERIEDLELLLEHHLERVYKGTGRHHPRIQPAALQILKTYEWPGNVRELRNFADRIFANDPGDVIWSEDLPPEFRRRQDPLAQTVSTGTKLSFSVGVLKRVELETIRSTIEACAGNVSEAANRLGINRSTIYRKLGRTSFSK